MQQFVPSVPVLLCTALVLGGVLLWLVVRRRSTPKPLPRKWALAPRPVFSNDERRFYRHLREAVPHLVVLSKLPLVRFCQPTNPQEVRFWYELLASSNVTFAICSANGRVLLAVDLETDRSPSRRSLQIKHSVLAACKVRYLRCAPDQLPAVADLQAMLPGPAVTSRMPSTSSPVSESRERLANTVASRRLERATQWQDSRSAPDSRFGAAPDSRFGAGVDSRFGTAVDSRFGAGADSRYGNAPDSRMGAAVDSRMGAAPDSRFGATSRFGVAPDSRIGTGAAAESRYGTAYPPATVPTEDGAVVDSRPAALRH